MSALGASPTVRVTEYGRLGLWLAKRVLKAGVSLPSGHEIKADWETVDKACSRGDELTAAGLSLLFSKCPLQVELGTRSIAAMADEAIKPLSSGFHHGKTLSFSSEGTVQAWKFKLKQAQGATNKVNVYSNEVLLALRAEKPLLHRRFTELSWAVRDLFDDQVSAALLYAATLDGYVSDPVQYALRCVLDPEGAKQLSTAIKALGANSHVLGSKLVECQVLQGRAVGEIDLVQEALRRTVRERAKATVVAVDQQVLRQAIRKILVRELEGPPEFEDVDAFWSRRWAWCVNGSHSRVLERVEPGWSVSGVAGQIHRRVFMENTNRNPLREWSGVSYFTASAKLEHGKTRALFAGDSVTYACFEHLLRPVEQVWRNQRCVLDPGAGGYCGMVSRIRRLQRQASMNVLLDYDDFNSQHSTEAMTVLFEELVDVAGYPAVLGDKICKSFQRSRVFVDGIDRGYSHGTLMSGHRATTFINTVLNEAYIRCYYPALDSCLSVHVGDDVFIAAHDMQQAADIVGALMASPLRMNPAKQSVGGVTCEFLRMAVGKDGAYGYPARSVASIVSGNWVNEVKLEPLEAIRSMVGSSWTLMNRTGNRGLYSLLVPSVVRMTRLKRSVVEDVLSCRVALGTGPQLRSGSRRRTVYLKEKRVPGAQDETAGGDYATRAYLTSHVSEVERLALTFVDHGVKNAMLNASYAKTLASRARGGSEDKVAISATRSESYPHSVCTVEMALGMSAKKGVLSKYPIIHLVANGLREHELRALVGVVEGDRDAVDIHAEAFGSSARGVVVDGWLPYSDASWLGGRVACDVLAVTFPVMV
jgi:hypothetical protein